MIVQLKRSSPVARFCLYGIGPLNRFESRECNFLATLIFLLEMI